MFDSTVTITIATPGVVTWTAHGITQYEMVAFTTTGALPTGIVSGTAYYVNVIDANSFHISTTRANAITGTFINTSGSQSGIHTGSWIKGQDVMPIITMTIATPAVISYPSHRLTAGTPFYLGTNGALPTGVLPKTLYYVLASGLTSDTLQFSATNGGAAINSSGTQSGLQWIYGDNVESRLLRGNQAITLSNVPLFVPINISNVIVGSSIRISQTSDNSEIALGVPNADGTFTALTKYLGNITVRVRNASGSPKYAAFETQAVTTTSGVSVFVSQVLDTTA